MSEEKKIVLITGASGGFGGLTAKTLAQEGHIVFASMRDLEGKNATKANELTTWAKENNVNFHCIELDVTNEDSIQQAIKKIIDTTGKIDVVVNNAGLGVIGLQETFTPEDWQKLFNVNVFGIQRVNRAVLPHMRKRKSGLLIHISSLLGRISLPFYGPYNASKWAVEALAENYRVELSGFGVDSCIIEPGGYPTTFMENLIKPSDTSQDASYGEFTKAPMNMFTNFEKALESNPAQKPQQIADAVAKLITTPAGQRPLRTVVDNMGMGKQIKGYNEQLHQITSGIYNAFGMGDMLKLKLENEQK